MLNPQSLFIGPYEHAAGKGTPLLGTELWFSAAPQFIGPQDPVDLFHKEHDISIHRGKKKVKHWRQAQSLHGPLQAAYTEDADKHKIGQYGKKPLDEERGTYKPAVIKGELTKLYRPCIYEGVKNPDNYKQGQHLKGAAYQQPQGKLGKASKDWGEQTKGYEVDECIRRVGCDGDTIGQDNQKGSHRMEPVDPAGDTGQFLEFSKLKFLFC